MPLDPRADHLRYYMAELDYLRREGAEFGRRFPRIAGALDLSEDGAADPHVERLLEAFAFLTGRLQRNLDRQLPRLAAAFLDLLYPHLLAPLPSLTMVQFRIDPGRASAAAGFELPRGTNLFAETDDGAAVRFRAASRVVLWPFEVAQCDRPSAELVPFVQERPDIGGFLRLRLKAVGDASLPDSLPDRLRVWIAAPMVTAAGLYEMIVETTRDVWVTAPAPDPGQTPRTTDIVTTPAVSLGPDAIRPAGFEDEDALLPHPERAHQGHRVVQEYFAMPRKFLFFDVVGIDRARVIAKGGWLDLVLAVGNPGLAPKGAERDAFKLGVVPAINLFPKVSEPVRIDHQRTEYPINPDHQFERSTEIHSIQKVTLTSREDRVDLRVAPLFSFDHGMEQDARHAHWTARRVLTNRQDMAGSEMRIAFRDLQFDMAVPDAQVAFAHCLCTNRGLAERLPLGTRLYLDVDAPVAEVVCAM